MIRTRRAASAQNGRRFSEEIMRQKNSEYGVTWGERVGRITAPLDFQKSWPARSEMTAPVAVRHRKRTDRILDPAGVADALVKRAVLRDHSLRRCGVV